MTHFTFYRRLERMKKHEKKVFEYEKKVFAGAIVLIAAASLFSLLFSQVFFGVPVSPEHLTLGGLGGAVGLAVIYLLARVGMI